MRHWLMKSEPASFSIDDLARVKRTGWDGVRNYQARNAMREMAVGDLALFYHSNADPPGVAGVARVCREAHPDPTAFDRRDPHFDPRSNPACPTWSMVEVEFVERFPHFVSLEELKGAKALAGMLLTSGKATRLSVQPVERRHFDAICKMGRA
ncbi:MAG TPA: EVE domain-containing protein [Candidatus Thermoplasmatota archaeon]|nr:EVE domain-containing protein [Candidatus Thermoplasmatota archaeon]